MRFPLLPVLFAFSGVFPVLVPADTATIPPSADASLFQLNSDFNFGGDETFPAGTLGDMIPEIANARGLFKFDIAGAVPAGSTITGASLTMRVTRSPGSAVNSSFALYKVFQDWGEGTGSGGGAGGRTALAGEVTWNSRFHGGATWDEGGGEIGGDFAEEASATRAVAGVGTYIFTFNNCGVEAVQSMLDSAESNFGWALVSLAEGTRFTARRWASRENANPPLLAITFTPPVLPGPVESPRILSFILDDGNGMTTLTFNREAGLVHRLERKISLNDPTWKMMGELPPIVQDSVGMFEFVKSIENEGYWRICARRGSPP